MIDLYSKIVSRFQSLGQEYSFTKKVFNPDLLPRFYENHHVEEMAQDYLEERINTGPSRKVGSSFKGNVCSEIPSRIMGHSTNSESRTHEFSFFVRAEVDPVVSGFFDQPPQVEILGHDKRGRRHRKTYTPDCLVISEFGLVVVEVKPSDALNNLSEKYPQDWVFDSGHWVYLPARKYFENLGITHIVWSPPPGSSVETANLQLLLQVPEQINKDQEKDQSQILKAIRKSRCATIASVMKQCELADRTSLLLLIRDQKLQVELNRSLLTDDNACWISESLNDLHLIYGAQNDATVSGFQVNSINDSDLPSESEIVKALKKVQVAEQENTRSGRRYRQLIKEGAVKGLSPVIAVLGRDKVGGEIDRRRRSKLPDKVRNFLTSYIGDHHGDLRKLNLMAAHIEYRVDARSAHPGFEPASHHTFKKYLEDVPRTKRAFARGGLRAANAVSCPTSPKERALKATRPFECATADHYLMDIYCQTFETCEKKYSARPWLSVLRDIATGAVLAIWVSFKTPSKSACAALLRMCARRHGKWPEAIIVDRGSDFQSKYFSLVLANRKVIKHDRPTSHPRYGSEAERFFQLLREQCLVHLEGNFVSAKDGRDVSSSHHAKNANLMSMRELISQCIKYINWHNSFAVGSGDTVPLVLMKEGLEKHPYSGIQVVVDDKFLIETAVDSKKYKLDPARGFHIGAWRYWNTALTLAKVKSYDVRIDPENPFLIYAKHEEEWLPCYSTNNDRYGHQSEIDQMVTMVYETIPHQLRAEQKSDADIKRIEVIREPVLVTAEVDISADGLNECSMAPTSIEDVFNGIEASGRLLECSKW